MTQTAKRTIKACGKTSRIPMALSNYMPACNEGHSKATAEFIQTIESQPMDVEKICRALNNHRWTCDRFEPYRPLDDGFIIKATDCWGNEDLIYIREQEEN